MAQKTSAKTKSKTTPSRAASAARRKAKSSPASSKAAAPARATSRGRGAGPETAAKKAPAANTAKARPRTAGKSAPAPKAAATRAKLPSAPKAPASRAKSAPPGKAATKPPSGAKSAAKVTAKAPPKAQAKAPPKAKPSKGAQQPATPAKAPRRRAPGHFDAPTLASIERKLVEQRTELLEQLHDLEEASFNLSQSEMSGEVSYDEDYADAGSFTFEREKDLSIANNVQDLLDKINRAVGKIEEGTYGICESCGEPIDAARLRALPHVSLCIRCKKAEERR
jgi:RNA polymerase-binding protein DksA